MATDDEDARRALAAKAGGTEPDDEGEWRETTDVRAAVADPRATRADLVRRAKAVEQRTHEIGVQYVLDIERLGNELDLLRVETVAAVGEKTAANRRELIDEIRLVEARAERKHEETLAAFQEMGRLVRQLQDSMATLHQAHGIAKARADSDLRRRDKRTEEKRWRRNLVIAGLSVGGGAAGAVVKHLIERWLNG